MIRSILSCPRLTRVLAPFCALAALVACPCVARAGITGVAGSQIYDFLGTNGPLGAGFPNFGPAANPYANNIEPNLSPLSQQQLFGLTNQAGLTGATKGAAGPLLSGILGTGALPGFAAFPGRAENLNDAAFQGAGTQTSAGVTVWGNYYAGFGNLNTTFTYFTTLPTFTEQPNAPGSGSYIVMFQTRYSFTGNLAAYFNQPAALIANVVTNNPGGGAYEIDAGYTYDVLNPAGNWIANLGGQGLTTGAQALGGPANINVPLSGFTNIAGWNAGANVDTLLMTGYFRMSGDPLSIDITSMSIGDSSTPEPSSVIMLMTGVCAVGLYVARRSRRDSTAKPVV